MRSRAMQTNPPGVVDVIADGGFGCDNGWAWAAMTGVMEDGDTTPTSTYVFRADGGAWTVPPRTEGRVAACGTLTAEQELLDVPPYPADAEIPESLWMDACWGN